MNIDFCSKDDFNQIISDIEDFWGSKRTLHLHHPSLLYEFGNTAFVVKENDRIIAYLFGYFSQCSSVGYVHLIAVRNGYQKSGLGKMLYAHFIKTAKTNGCRFVKAITSLSNTGSINFHKSIGMKLTGNMTKDGIQYEKGTTAARGKTGLFL